MTTVAIDFGTSNTVVCFADPVTRSPCTLNFDRLSRRFAAGRGVAELVPSLVFVQTDGQLVFGEVVRSQRLGLAQPERFFQSFKRDLAADYRPPDRQIDGYAYTPEFVSEHFLYHLWQRVCERVQPSQVVFTVPVGAFERYRDWFLDFASRYKLPPVRLLDESTAAALGYAVQRPGTVVLVIDFGGGTLDLSLVRTIGGEQDQPILRAEVLAKSDAYVGGVDIDVWIVEHYLNQIGSSRSEVREMGWLNLLEIAERLKIQLSQAQEAKESWFDDEVFMAHDLTLTREELAEILETRQLLEQMRQALDEVLTIALNKGISKTDIEQVLLVGGSCQIPAVQQLVLSYFGRQRVKLDKPFEAVAHGALEVSRLTEIEDYLRHSYAIRLWEPYSKTYSYYTLFERGIRYPCERLDPLILQTAQDGQKEIRLDIGELATLAQAEVNYDSRGRMTSGQLTVQSEFRSLESHHEQVCVAHLDPPGDKGLDRIEVRFEVNGQRVLLATVRDLVTGEILVNGEAIAKLQ
ncbi:molecular chaperone DnaK [Leptolyngbya sp. 'hensonii']|uniref:Hsp70 family protein n=1 Tax=Leptolyngbya sp. 'hensonii' TaxID=1922337 RepID=UPI00094FD54A|nr:Hsp70 family protein [Leptolyngbya sp. 'hensonii']OLP17198.1 molecular chaperone DnaK [Leptolyngbya sp. 'hensonii']